MRTLAALLVALVVVFWAPAAKAHCPGHEHCGEEPPPPAATLGDLSCTTDQIAKFDGIDWVCAEDNSGFVVRDDADNLLGTVINVSDSTATVLFAEDPLIAPWLAANPIAAMVLKPDGFQSTNPAGSAIVRWTALGCFGERGDVY